MAWNEPGGGNQHDPWSGGGRRGGGDNGGGGNRGGNQGPPGRGEALKKFQDKLNHMLGGRGGRAEKTAVVAAAARAAGVRVTPLLCPACCWSLRWVSGAPWASIWLTRQSVVSCCASVSSRRWWVPVYTGTRH